MAHVGGLVSIAAVIAYLLWRITSTLPHGEGNRIAAWILISFEVVALLGATTKTYALWNIDAPAPPAVVTGPAEGRLIVLIPTYNEPGDVIAPTVAAACALEPAHETWVLDDGDRLWVEEMAEAYGARYISREVHDHAKAGNINNALRIMAEETADGNGDDDIIAVLDCDHVPLPTFLTATLGWFADPEIAIVQCPQEFYNKGAFDDDGGTGEQGLFFNVLLPARHHSGAGPFWCGSTSILRARALRQVGGVATETVVEDMHTTLKLIRLGWRVVYHHQTVAVGLAPGTSDQYLIQRRRWGMGAMQVLRHERLWAAKRWMSWRNFYEYLVGALWWLEGLATLGVFAIPATILLSGFQTSTARPLTFSAVFVTVFSIRLWGAKRLLRGHIHWPTAFALRVFRIPIGLSCAWWLVARRSLQFEVTPKGGEQERYRGSAPKVLWAILAVLSVIVGYAAAGVGHLVPWRSSLASTVASGVWLVLGGSVLLFGLQRIRSRRFVTSRRDAPRVPLRAAVHLDAVAGELIDVSVGGASVRLPPRSDRPSGLVSLVLPGADPIKLQVLPAATRGDVAVVAMRVEEDDWETRRALSLWLFHTPDGAVAALPPGVPVIGVTTAVRVNAAVHRATRNAPARVPAPAVTPVPAAPVPVVAAARRPAAARRVQPAAVQPAAVQPAAVQPAAVQPAKVQPAAVQPAAVQPAAVQPAAVQPAAVQPAAMQPGPVSPSAPVRSGNATATEVPARSGVLTEAMSLIDGICATLSAADTSTIAFDPWLASDRAIKDLEQYGDLGSADVDRGGFDGFELPLAAGH